MFFKLTEDKIKSLDAKYLNDIKATKDLITPLAKEELRLMKECYSEEIDDQIFYAKSVLFWNDYEFNLSEEDGKEKELDFESILYLTKHYLNGNLYTFLDYRRPIDNDHKLSIPTLQLLNEKGILTRSGQRSKGKMQRSYLDFAFAINEDNVERGFELLKNLYKAGLNVSACIQVGDKERNIIMFESETKSVYDLDAISLDVEIPTELVLVSHPTTMSHLDGPNYLQDILDIDIKFPSNCVFAVTIFNKKWNMIQADEILLSNVIQIETEFFNNAPVEELTDEDKANCLNKLKLLYYNMTPFAMPSFSKIYQI